MTEDEDSPRIVARGEWYQDENGDTTYVPAHIRPSYVDELEAERAEQEEDGPEPLDQVAPLGVWANPPEPHPYKLRSDDTWQAIRTDYLAGDPAQVVAERYGVGLSTLRARAAREHWRRRDQPDPEPFSLDEGAPAPDLDTLSRHALARMDLAIRKGRAAEAASWMRTWRSLASPPVASPPVSSPPAPATGPTPPPARRPDVIDQITDIALEAERIVQETARRLPTLTAADRAEIDARVEALMARMPGLNETDETL